MLTTRATYSFSMKIKRILPVVCFLSFGILTIGCNSLGDGKKLAIAQNASERKDTSLHNRYSWKPVYRADEMLVNRIALPAGYTRTEVRKNSFADWLRHIPLKAGFPEVMLYNGKRKANQAAQFAVLDIDVGTGDLQQCADAVMRLKAEYHFSRKEHKAISFRFTSGDEALYTRWIEGYRPVVKNNKVSWTKQAPRDESYKGFRAYLKQVFMYAGTSSLSKEMQAKELSQMSAGDVFIKGGFPGHAVIVMDMAENKATGEKIFLLAQSYMPAQDIHVLKNPAAENSPWYSLAFTGKLETPEWVFEQSDLKMFMPYLKGSLPN